MLKELSDQHFPNAKQIVLVQDNLSTHTAASLYAAFPADEARRLVKRFEWHYTPKHGSWLDMAESELGVLSSQCLSRRIPNKQAEAPTGEPLGSIFHGGHEAGVGVRRDYPLRAGNLPEAA